VHRDQEEPGTPGWRGLLCERCGRSVSLGEVDDWGEDELCESCRTQSETIKYVSAGLPIPLDVKVRALTVPNRLELAKVRKERKAAAAKRAEQGERLLNGREWLRMKRAATRNKVRERIGGE